MHPMHHLERPSEPSSTPCPPTKLSRELVHTIGRTDNSWTIGIRAEIYIIGTVVSAPTAPVRSEPSTLVRSE